MLELMSLGSAVVRFFKWQGRKAHLGGVTVKKLVDWNCNWKAFEIQGTLDLQPLPISVPPRSCPHPISGAMWFQACEV